MLCVTLIKLLILSETQLSHVKKDTPPPPSQDYFVDSKLNLKSLCSIGGRSFDDNNDYDQDEHYHQLFI